MITAILAMDNKRCIGKDNTLPWHFSEDLAFFKEYTHGQVVIMGRKTYESIGKPLPNRINVVISSTVQDNHNHNNPIRVTSIQGALDIAKHYTDKKTIIIGGASIYEQAFQGGIVDEVMCTVIDMEIDGDAYAPAFEMNYNQKTLLQSMKATNKTDGKEYTLTFYNFCNKANSI